MSDYSDYGTSMTADGLDPWERAFERLSSSAFRSRFRLSEKDRATAVIKGPERIAEHARAILAERLAPAVIPNDGRQTPYRGHPVFTAQHATACCCRQCFQKWWGVPAGRQLTTDELNMAVGLITRWIARDLEKAKEAEETQKAASAARRPKSLKRGETGSLF